MKIKIVGLLMFISMAVLAQDDASQSSDAETDTATEEETDVDLDDLEINTDDTEEDDGVFIPTDEVSYQQSVPFPTDI